MYLNFSVKVVGPRAAGGGQRAPGEGTESPAYGAGQGSLSRDGFNLRSHPLDQH